MAELAVIIRPDFLLEPSLEADWDVAHKLGPEMMILSYTRIRSPKNHRRYMAMHQIAYQNRSVDDLTQDAYGFRKMIEMTAGYRTPVRTFKGETIYLPKSMKWSEADEDTLVSVKKACGDVICERIGFKSKEDKKHFDEEIIKLAYINSP